MSKILIISALFPPEPVVSAKLSFDIAFALSIGNEVIVISPKPSRPLGFQFKGETLSFNFKHIQVSSYIFAGSNISGRFRESYSFGKHSYRYIADNHKSIDVIYANTWPLLAQYFAVKATKKYKIPLILHVQDIYPESISQKLPIAASLVNIILKPLDTYILSNATKIIAISEKMKNYLVLTRKLKANKVEVIRNWQDESSFLNFEENKTNKLFTFMYLGSISPAAGVDLLIHSFQKAELGNAQLIIAGDGSDKGLCMNIANNYQNKNIHFIDAPLDLVPSIQSTADILLLPLKKGIGLTASPSKLPSYMFSAKPVIACVDKESDTELVINAANCGWVIEPENIEMLSKLMQEIVLVPKEMMSLFGENGRKYALANYSKKINSQKLVSIITDTIPT